MDIAPSELLRAYLRDTLGRVRPKDLPSLLGVLEEGRAQVLARLLLPRDEGTPDANLNIAEAAQRLGVSVDWLYRNAKKLPSLRIGRRLLFPAKALDRWNKQRQGR